LAWCVGLIPYVNFDTVPKTNSIQPPARLLSR